MEKIKKKIVVHESEYSELFKPLSWHEFHWCLINHFRLIKIRMEKLILASKESTRLIINF